jgi:glycosyltransferase involved in cell wall biosynthesis
LPRLRGYGDILLSTVPIIPVFWRRPAVAVVHDLRHEDRPADFTFTHRLARDIVFNAAYRKADRLLADSARTAHDLAARYPKTGDRTSVVYLGADHVAGRVSTRDGDAVAWAAKEPDLLLQAWQILKQESKHFKLRLRVIGCSDAQRERLTHKAIQLGIADQVLMDPYVNENDLNRVMGTASAMLLPSRFEGFGLPLLEAMRQGVPTMISPDPALQEVGGGHAACAASWEPHDVAAAIRQSLNMTRDELLSARQHADQFTWRRTVELTRANLEAALRSADPCLKLSSI